MARGDRKRQRADRRRAEPCDQRPRLTIRSRSCRRRSRRASRPRRRSWCSTSGCPTARLFEALRRRSWPATAACSRSTARTRSCSMPPSPTASSAVTYHHATTLLRDHRTSRRWRPRALSPSRATGLGAPVHVVDLSLGAAALDEVRRAKAAGVRATAESCPNYLDLHRRELRRPRSRRRARVRHRAAAPRLRRPRSAVGGPCRWLARPGRHGPRPRPGRRREGRCRPRRAVQRDEQRCTRDRDPARGPVLRGVATRRITVERMVDLHGHDAGPSVRDGDQKAPSRWAGTPTSCCSTLAPRRTIRASDLHHTQRLHAVRGSRGLRARSAMVLVRGACSSSATACSLVGAGSGGSSSEGRSEPRDGPAVEHEIQAEEDPGDAVESDAGQGDRAEDRRVRRAT